MPARRNSLLLSFFLLTAWSAASAQITPAPTPAPSPKPQDDVVRVYTELVQTDVMVFDRAGNQFFLTNAIDKGWDGTFREQPAQVGVYAYVIIYAFDGGKTRTLHGDITLIR